MKRAALIVFAVAAIAGCGSTVFLGSLPSDSTDMARPPIDMTQYVPMTPDGATDFGGFDAAPLVDLAQ